MARMSIDDKFPRDPRVRRLAARLGWSRQQAMGALIDVFAICYDRETDLLPAVDVDVAAEQPGFADLMFEVDLAEQVRGRVRIRGAKERIKYLDKKVEAGRVGGLKSAETRRNKAKQNRSTLQAPVNPPDPVPDVVPDPVPVPDLPDPDLSPARAPAPQPPEPGDPGLAERQALRKELWQELATARGRAARELGVAYRPLLAQDPGETKLALLLRGAGGELDQVAGAVRNAIAVAAAEAVRDQKLEWLTGAIFEDRNFRRLAAGDPKAASRPRPAKPGEPVRMPPRKADPSPPVVVVSDADRADAAAALAESRTKLFGIVDGGTA